MALQVEVDHLTKDELLFELQARGLDCSPSSTVEELKQQFKSTKNTSHDNTKANTFISSLVVDDEFQVCEGKLDAVLAADHASSSCRRRCQSKLSHVILRLEKLFLESQEQQIKKIALVAKAYTAIKDLKCSQTPGTSSQGAVASATQQFSPAECHRHTSQVLKWGLVYDGRGPVHDFVFRLQELKDSSEVSDSELLRNAVHLFSGEALMWFRTNRTRFYAFEDLVESLKDEFQPVEYERCLLNQIRARLQDKNESIRSYVNIMESLFLRLTVPITDAEQLDIIMTNMSPYFISRLALTEVRTVRELKNICARLEVSKFKCENRGFLNIGREPVIPNFCTGISNSIPSTSDVRQGQNRDMPSCGKCGGNHHHSRCDAYPTTVCFRCKRPGVLTRNCPCSKN
jgi:hypothetical protein